MARVKRFHRLRVFQRRYIAPVLSLQKRQSKAFLADMLRARGLMPLLMKRRNGSDWTAEEKQELREQLRALSRASPYLALMLLPGSVFFLPAYAWWLDRRRQYRSKA